MINLTEKQKIKLKEHSKIYSKKHMAMMTQLMKSGKSFAEAHIQAKKIIGK